MGELKNRAAASDQTRHAAVREGVSKLSLRARKGDEEREGEGLAEKGSCFSLTYLLTEAPRKVSAFLEGLIATAVKVPNDKVMNLRFVGPIPRGICPFRLKFNAAPAAHCAVG